LSFFDAKENGEGEAGQNQTGLESEGGKGQRVEKNGYVEAEQSRKYQPQPRCLNARDKWKDFGMRTSRNSEPENTQNLHSNQQQREQYRHLQQQ